MGGAHAALVCGESLYSRLDDSHGVVEPRRQLAHAPGGGVKRVPTLRALHDGLAAIRPPADALHGRGCPEVEVIPKPKLPGTRLPVRQRQASTEGQPLSTTS